ncbi:MAG: hypothetical protein QOK04_1741 [Solirubrobacteraceae bacterium]|nr:hypothetical protein [Solirubrobacteraceae bacterium]
MSGRIVIGTSSWADPGFVADWYPQGMPARERLSWYARHFEAVELNSSFYAIPERGAVEGWVRATPAGFTFDVKLHRLLSRHSASLESLPPDLRAGARTSGRGRVQLTPELEEQMVERLLDALEPLEGEGKLGALLVQLSPSFSPRRHSLEELEPLLEQLSPRRVAVELRNRGWVDEDRVTDVLSFLSEHRAVFVSVDTPAVDHFMAMPPIDAVTNSELAYLRAHGRNAHGFVSGKTVAERFGHVYDDRELGEIASRANELAREAAEVHVMFNNNRSNDAPVAAQRLRELYGQPVQPAAPEQLDLR